MGVNPPIFIEVQVTQTDPGFKGNTATRVPPSLPPSRPARRSGAHVPQRGRDDQGRHARRQVRFPRLVSAPSYVFGGTHVSGIYISGIGIAPEVLAAVVSRAVEEIEGIASVGVKDLATNLVSMLSARSTATAPAVETEVVDDQLAITVHLVVFFGYPFKKLAEVVREAVVHAIDAQVGVSVARVDVCIDGLVFPKE